MVEDCGCWTDAQGYWRLSPGCLQAEHDQFARAMQRVPGIIAEINEQKDRKKHQIEHVNIGPKSSNCKWCRDS